MDLYSDIPMSIKPAYGFGFVPQLLFAGVDGSVEDLLASDMIVWEYNPSRLPLKVFESGFPATFKKISVSGIDLMKDKIGFTWMAHYMLGGIRINANCETSVRGLYAAGEVAGGVTGKGRLPGTGIMEGLIFGDIAGKQAVRHARSFDMPVGAKYPRVNIERHELRDWDFMKITEIRKGIAGIMYSALRDRTGNSSALLLGRTGDMEKETCEILGDDPDFIGSVQHAPAIFELRNALVFSRLYLEANSRHV
jgi:hypothetical protein